jgi:hypothetical protein
MIALGIYFIFTKKEEAKNPEPDIIVETPKPNDVVSGNFSISGKAKENWYFEAVFPVRLVDENNNEFASGQARATSDWTVPDYVPFTGEINFSSSTETTTTGFVIFKNDNPSGDPSRDKEFRVPVTIAPKK